MSGYSIDEIHVGMKKSVSKTITESDIYTYAGIIGDINPLHVNEEYAKNTRFKTRIAHGMLTASFFSTLVGMSFRERMPYIWGKLLSFYYLLK
ncbi:MAG: MaoC/PaaZ C-terminal domain-containing protein [Peptoanaerobacter stomatis]|uniref:MaoC/PaaZ C-terminal domain-containing protein n=1 Tax=Peptoanaerobacter stomatis TaxID=796937 RepID=UPI003F9F087F